MIFMFMQKEKLFFVTFYTWLFLQMHLSVENENKDHTS